MAVLRQIRLRAGALLAAALAAVCLTLVSADSARAQQNYGIRAGDVLRVEVLEDASLNRTVLVTPDGRITFPQAGSLQVSGRSVDVVQRDLTNRLATGFAAPPNVFVSVERLADRTPVTRSGPAAAPVIDVFVVGEAGKTGLIEVSPGTTVLQMFGMMGGFSKFAAIKRIQLRRTDPATNTETVYRLDYTAIERGQSASGSTVLADGDVIMVPQRRLFE